MRIWLSLVTETKQKHFWGTHAGLQAWVERDVWANGALIMWQRAVGLRPQDSLFL
jgi:hypothetical protein